MYATPKMSEGGEVKWFIYIGEAKGVEGERPVYDMVYWISAWCSGGGEDAVFG